MKRRMGETRSGHRIFVGKNERKVNFADLDLDAEG
jgi:hypothetical protein